MSPATKAWYTSANGWMVEAASGQIALDSFRSCAEHDGDGRRDCENCEDGPMVEEGHTLGDYDGGSIPIYESATDRLVATADYQTEDGSMRLTREVRK